MQEKPINIFLIKIEALCTKNEDFDQTNFDTGSKCRRVKARSDIP